VLNEGLKNPVISYMWLIHNTQNSIQNV